MRQRFLDRRGFLQSASVAALGASSPVNLFSLSVDASSPRQLAIIGTMGACSGLFLYEVRESGWKLLQNIPSKAPVSLLLHPNREALYVLNQIDQHEGLPRGTVEAYRLNQGNGNLTFQCRQPLSLSAIEPQHMALSPNGTSLAIAVAGGGAYNLLPLLPDGQPGRVSSIRKEFGSGPLESLQDSSHPQAVIFAPSGHVMIASDLGCDRLSVFSTENGIERTASMQLPAGSGPRHLALHADGELLFADHALAGAISVFRLNEAGLTAIPGSTTRGAFGDALALHPSGDVFYSAGCGSLAAWRVHPATGRIRPLQSIQIGSVRGLAFHPNGSALFATTAHGVTQFRIAAANGLLGDPQTVTSIPGAHSIVFA